MTHEELLAKIATPNEFIGVKYAPDWQSAALRAVVELHKPVKPRKHMCGCDYCPPFDCEKCRSFYPCSTIQAIEKELK